MPEKTKKRMSFWIRQGSVLSPVLFAVYRDDICRLSNVILGTVVLYADDILLIAPSESILQKLLLAREKELDAIDMVINVKKSSDVRVGRRHKVTCAHYAEITTSEGDNLTWVKEIRYLGFLLLVMFPLDALQITPNVTFIVQRMQFLPRWSLCLRRGDS